MRIYPDNRQTALPRDCEKGSPLGLQRNGQRKARIAVVSPMLSTLGIA